MSQLTSIFWRIFVFLLELTYKGFEFLRQQINKFFQFKNSCWRVDSYTIFASIKKGLCTLNNNTTTQQLNNWTEQQAIDNFFGLPKNFSTLCKITAMFVGFKEFNTFYHIWFSPLFTLFDINWWMYKGSSKNRGSF